MVTPAYTVLPEERVWYYYGVAYSGDQPELLYRTSWEKNPWVVPTGRWAIPPHKFARPVHKTPLNGVWDAVGPLVDDLVYAAVKRSYSINTARFLTVPNGYYVHEGALGSAVIWISVYPGSTSVDVAHEVSQQILQLLASNGVDEVDVEWCEGVTSRLAAPVLLPTGCKYDHDATARVRRHLTTALSIPIAAAMKADTDDQGSAGLYFHENLDKDGNRSDKVLAVTTHHVVCGIDSKTYDFRADNSPRQQVRVCGYRRFQQGLDEIRDKIEEYGYNAIVCAEKIARLETKIADGDSDEDGAARLEKARRKLGELKTAIVELEEFYKEATANWSDTAHRNIGFLDYSPPISVDVNNERYTRDWATIRLDEAKFRPHFIGNVINFGAVKLSAPEFSSLMHPRIDAQRVVEYPWDGLLKIKGFVTKEQLASPELVDINGNPCLVVLKDGSASGLTFGRYAGLDSFLCDENGVRSVELAIYNYDEYWKNRPFSSKGDSGSLIVNGKGEMVGLLHSGQARNRASSTSTHITYVTPAWRLCKWIKEIYPSADFARETW